MSGNDKPMQPTARLRFIARETHAVASIHTERVLQQAWQDASESIEWRDVPLDESGKEMGYLNYD